MVQKRILTILYNITARILLACATVYIAVLTSEPFYNLNKDFFYYKNPSGFFMASWADWVLATCLALLFWSGSIFGAIGKKTDYLIISLVLLFGVWNYLYTENVTLFMYTGLVGSFLAGNLIGFVLKLLRLQFFGKKFR